VLKLVRGEIDMLQGDVPPEMVTWLERRRDLVVQRARGSNLAYLGFNLEDAQLARRELRLAIAHAIDREVVIRHLFAGAARPAASVLPPEHWAGHPGLDGYRHDPARARALLAELGHGESNPVRLQYKTSSDPLRLRLATVLQDQLRRVGIHLEVRSHDWGTFYGDIKAGRFQTFGLTWVGIKTPDIFRYAFHSASLPPAGANRGRLRSAEVDRLVEQAEAAEDPQQQRALYRALQERLLHELPAVPLWYEDHVYAARPDLSGYALAADGGLDGLIALERPQPVAVR
jgi:peptide/nickel transport system substrate-binding protein